MPLGLPDAVQGLLFDMDGVLTKTASVHAAAWKATFDEFLRDWSSAVHRPPSPLDPGRFDPGRFDPAPFDEATDYERYVDGRSRVDGTRSFLASRHITLAEGDPSDPPGTPTVNGLSNRKNEILLAELARTPVEVFPDTIEYVRAAAAAGLPRAVVSASANTAQVLSSAGIAELFDARIDGLVASERHLAGKPAPDMYLAGVAELGLDAAHGAVFEDALAGVQAGRAGSFAYVVGVDRVGQAAELLASGADIVVTDVSQLLR